MTLRTTMIKANVLKTNMATVKKVSAMAIFTVLAGCQTLPSTVSKNPNANLMSNPLTARMPVIDRQGYIAYVEEQGAGAAKVSRLYSIRPDGSDRQLIDELSGYIYAPAWSADGQLLAYRQANPAPKPKDLYLRHQQPNAQSGSEH